MLTTKQQHVGAGNEPPMFGIDVILCKSIESDLNLEKIFSMTFASHLYIVPVIHTCHRCDSARRFQHVGALPVPIHSEAIAIGKNILL